jgi:hypothetical protein
MRLLTPVDFNKLGATNFRFDNLSSAPGSPVAGQTYYDTTVGVMMVYNGTVWLACGGDYLAATYSVPGALTVQTGSGKIYNDTGRTRTIVAVRLAVGTAPTGAGIICDINKNGTTIYTTQANRPTIAAAGTTVKSTNPDITSWADGDQISVDIDQIGSTVAGSNLTVTITAR